MEELVFLQITNTSYPNKQEHKMMVSKDSVHDVVRWYGGYCAGDEYVITINNNPVELDLNGEMKPLV